MSSIESALADTSRLTDYRGRQVLAVAAKLTNAGDGLSKSQAIAPTELEIGDEVFILYRASVTKHDHQPIDKDNPRGPLKLEMAFKASTAMIVDKSFAEAKIADQEAHLREAADRAKNVVPLGPQIAEAEKKARRGGKAEATADRGKNPPPAAPAAGATDDEGFHDPALAGASPIKGAAKKAPAAKKA